MTWSIHSVLWSWLVDRTRGASSVVLSNSDSPNRIRQPRSQTLPGDDQEEIIVTHFHCDFGPVTSQSLSPSRRSARGTNLNWPARLIIGLRNLTCKPMAWWLGCLYKYKRGDQQTIITLFVISRIGIGLAWFYTKLEQSEKNYRGNILVESRQYCR